MSRQKLNRQDFLRLLGSSGLGIAAAGWPSAALSAGAPPQVDPIDRLFAEDLIFDGVVNIGIERNAASARTLPRGEITARTGIHVGNHSIRLATLPAYRASLERAADAILIVERAGDIDRARADGRYGLVFYVQSNVVMNGSIAPLEEWRDIGLRVFQLTYSDVNELGGGSDFDDVGLTPLGRDTVMALNEMSMIVDTSHCGRRTTLEACEVSDAPVTANHAAVEALTPHSRGKSDDELRAIAATGGVVGVTLINRFFSLDWSRPADINDYIAHIDYMVELIGPDHVGVSTDGYMDGTHRYEVDHSGPLLNSWGRWKHLARALHERGYSIEDLRKIMGMNFKRICDQVLEP